MTPIERMTADCNRRFAQRRGDAAKKREATLIFTHHHEWKKLSALVHKPRYGFNGVIRRLATTYEVRGKLASLSSDDKSNIGLENVVNEARFMYDDNSQLTDD